MTRALLVVLFVFALVSPAFPGDAPAKDLKALQGKWKMAALEVNGVDVPAHKLDGTVMHIQGDEYTVKLKGKEIKVKLRLDPGKKPKEIDMIFQDGPNKDKVHKGIYRLLDKDRFQFCRGLNPEQPRPTEFGTWPDTNYFLVTWQRVQD